MRDDLHAVRDSGGEHRRQVDVPASRLAGSIPSGNSDVAIYLLGLAEMTGVDMQDEIEAKMAKNTARIYQRLPNGVLAKSNSDAD